ncbi:MAG TPA: DUF4159 domain-containing protein [Pyrinomonadaceae bacterium]
MAGRRPQGQSPHDRLRRALKLARRAALPVALVALVLMPAAGQRRRRGGGTTTPPELSVAAERPRNTELPTDGPAGPAGEFTFARAIYTSPFSPYWTRYGGSWTVDYPEADNHFITGMREWAGTNLNITQRPEAIELLDERLFNYPFIYFVEPGFMELSPEEAARLREYILRGGFLFLDDFWGESEWQNVQTQLKKVLPEYEIKELPLTHPILHSYLDIEEVVQVPNIYNAQRGITGEKGGNTPYYMGIEDKSGRLVVFISRNSDLGDAWEWINDPRYPVKYGLAAYRIGINVVIYAMSH